MDTAKMLVMNMFGGGGVQYETPSYANVGGTGDRTAIIIITATIGLMNDDQQSTWNALINGNMTGQVWFNSGLDAAGKQIKLDFGHLVVCDKIRWTQDIIASQGTWVVRSSPDNNTYTAISSNAALGSSASQEIACPGGSTPFRYLALDGVSGTTSSAAYTIELEISIGNPI